tara:strand:+ start:231 stop:413 length:183 start_codon:yes stop_codon:yes gene_type:complete
MDQLLENGNVFMVKNDGFLSGASWQIDLNDVEAKVSRLTATLNQIGLKGSFQGTALAAVY